MFFQVKIIPFKSETGFSIAKHRSFIKSIRDSGLLRMYAEVRGEYWFVVYAEGIHSALDVFEAYPAAESRNMTVDVVLLEDFYCRSSGKIWEQDQPFC